MKKTVGSIQNNQLHQPLLQIKSANDKAPYNINGYHATTAETAKKNPGERNPTGRSASMVGRTQLAL